jgi:TPR repeat protein
MGSFLRALGLLFPAAFLLVSLWGARQTLKGFAGVVVGRPVDQRAMGLLRLQGDGFLKPDQAAAVDWFRKAALQGDAPAQLHLARALSSGRGASRNLDEALRWSEAAARQGSPEAMRLTGELWQTRDAATAMKWYQKATEAMQPGLRARDPWTCLSFGLMHCTGQGVPADPVEGLAWMKVAEQWGLPSSQAVLIRLIETRISPAQREAAERRAKALLSPP